MMALTVPVGSQAVSFLKWRGSLSTTPADKVQGPQPYHARGREAGGNSD
jgi:hypothetical protein